METLTKHAVDKVPLRATAEKPQARLEFAQRLRELRVPKGFRTARSLAKALGIDENRYTRYERAEVEPDLALIRRMCQALGVTPTELLGPPDACGANAYGDGGGMPRTFVSPAHPSRDEQPVVGIRPPRVIGAEFAAWKLACAAAEARLSPRSSETSGGETSMAMLAVASPLYQKLRAAPFETIAELASDRSIAGASPQLAGRVVAAIDALVAALQDQAGRSA